MTIRLTTPLQVRRFDAALQLVLVLLPAELEEAAAAIDALQPDAPPLTFHSARPPKLKVRVDSAIAVSGRLEAGSQEWSASLSRLERDRWVGFLRDVASPLPSYDHIDLIDDARGDDLQLTLRVDRPIQSVPAEEVARRLGIDPP